MLSKAYLKKCIKHELKVIQSCDNGTYPRTYGSFFAQPADFPHFRKLASDKVAQYKHLIYRRKLLNKLGKLK